jgi:hypothetical protein
MHCAYPRTDHAHVRVHADLRSCDLHVQSRDMTAKQKEKLEAENARLEADYQRFNRRNKLEQKVGGGPAGGRGGGAECLCMCCLAACRRLGTARSTAASCRLCSQAHCGTHSACCGSCCCCACLTCPAAAPAPTAPDDPQEAGVGRGGREACQGQGGSGVPGQGTAVAGEAPAGGQPGHGASQVSCTSCAGHALGMSACWAAAELFWVKDAAELVGGCRRARTAAWALTASSGLAAVSRT